MVDALKTRRSSLNIMFSRPGVVLHASIPSAWEAEAGRWFTKVRTARALFHRETLAGRTSRTKQQQFYLTSEVLSPVTSP